MEQEDLGLKAQTTKNNYYKSMYKSALCINLMAK